MSGWMEFVKGGGRVRACALLFSPLSLHLLEVARRQDGGQGGLARILEADQGELQLLVEEEAVGMEKGGG